MVGACTPSVSIYLSCANTLQTFVDANTKLSDVAVDTEQCI